MIFNQTRGFLRCFQEHFLSESPLLNHEIMYKLNVKKKKTGSRLLFISLPIILFSFQRWFYSSRKRGTLRRSYIHIRIRDDLVRYSDNINTIYNTLGDDISYCIWHVTVTDRPIRLNLYITRDDGNKTVKKKKKADTTDSCATIFWGLVWKENIYSNLIYI